MSDPRNPLLVLPSVDPADDAAREARHQLIAALLAAYADGELPAETVSQLDAHLVGCARCRREVRLHVAVRGRLAAEPTAAALPALRARIADTIRATPAPTPAPGHAVSRRRRAGALLLALAGSGALLGAPLLGPNWRGDEERRAPVRPAAVVAADDALLRAVVADYRRVMAQALPGRARDLDAVRGAVPFPVEPLRAAELRLLAAWTTQLGGEPAAVLAYRWGDRLVVQYLLSDAHFFGSPALRSGVAAAHLVSASDGSLSILAWPTASAGTLLLADVAPARLATLWTVLRVADRDAGGAQ